MKIYFLFIKSFVLFLLLVSAENSFAFRIANSEIVYTITLGGGCDTSSIGCTSSTISTIGSGSMTNTSSNYPAPYGNWYTAVKQQYLYTVAELNAAGMTAGKIDQIDFDVTTINGITTYLNYSVRIGCTSLTSFGTSPTAFETGLYNVFPSQTYSLALGWNAHPFINAFEWDGTSNIIIEVCMNQLNPGANYTANCGSKCDATSYPASLVSLSDSQDQCPVGAPVFLQTYNTHPQIRLHNCAWLPSSTSELTYQNIKMDVYPNPFNDKITIELELSENDLVQLEVYDLVGRKLTSIVDERKQAGVHKLIFDASDIKYSSGMYMLKLKTDNQIISRKLILTK